MKRRLFNALALTSLLLGLVVAATWVVGREHTIVVGYGVRAWPGTDEWIVVLDGRSVWAGRTRVPPLMTPARGSGRGLIFRQLGPTNTGQTLRDGFPKSQLSDYYASALGFAVVKGHPFVSAASLAGVLVPSWFLLFLLLITPAYWLTLHRGRWRRQRLAAAGLCVRCGYDLRATTERCPECGTVIERASGPLSPVLARRGLG